MTDPTIKDRFPDYTKPKKQTDVQEFIITADIAGKIWLQITVVTHESRQILMIVSFFWPSFSYLMFTIDYIQLRCKILLLEIYKIAENLW